MLQVKLKNYISFFIALFFLILPYQLFAANKIIAVTEHYPPYNMIENENIVGVSADIMRELFKRAKIEYTLNIYPWAHSYKLALEEPNTVVFATSRTPEREKLFKWVGPIGESNWAFFAKKGSKIVIKSLEDAKKFRVGGYYGDATSEYLIKNGFIKDKSLLLATNEVQNAFKLEAGRIDLWATGSLLAPYISESEKTGSIVELFTIKKSDLYAAFNIKTDETLIKKLNALLVQMNKDKVIDNISKKYK
ncbi:substrate-binding periplasmic protein [Fluviispira multicolorata]|uniref:Transporter substrate-binding domain-containing protein n=1 Tax=Fluviispira multicolorata TaxID=2654512 RepID=A0A833N6D4_9BACT|nr:ABC transporter substrate-binding protein [Fluviispira multicolorata]KAB8033280.1 transporter substrate-binding domain-containing protein [Fluviispira multicolorata]